MSHCQWHWISVGNFVLPYILNAIECHLVWMAMQNQKADDITTSFGKMNTSTRWFSILRCEQSEWILTVVLFVWSIQLRGHIRFGSRAPGGVLYRLLKIACFALKGRLCVRACVCRFVYKPTSWQLLPYRVIIKVKSRAPCQLITPHANRWRTHY